MMPLTMAKTGQNVENADASMLAAIGYMCLWAYVLALIVYQIGGLIAG